MTMDVIRLGQNFYAKDAEPGYNRYVNITNAEEIREDKKNNALKIILPFEIDKNTPISSKTELQVDGSFEDLKGLNYRA